MTTKRKRRGSGKGGSFERRLCKMLSLWWTNNKRDDLYWRSAGSGSRATVRRKQGGKMLTGHGDICAVDPLGQPLLDLITIEAKNGYSKVHPTGLVDKPHAKGYQLEEWIAKAHISKKASGSYSWVIVHQRLGRACMIYMPRKLFETLELATTQIPKPLLSVLAVVPLNKKTKLHIDLVCFPFKTFLDSISPQLICDLARAKQRQ